MRVETLIFFPSGCKYHLIFWVLQRVKPLLLLLMLIQNSLGSKTHYCDRKRPVCESNCLLTHRGRCDAKVYGVQRVLLPWGGKMLHGWLASSKVWLRLLQDISTTSSTMFSGIEIRNRLDMKATLRITSFSSFCHHMNSNRVWTVSHLWVCWSAWYRDVGNSPCGLQDGVSVDLTFSQKMPSDLIRLVSGDFRDQTNTSASLPHSMRPF